MLEPISKIKLKLGIEPNGRVQKFFTNTCYKHMDKYVPRETGTLRRVVQVDSDKITYQSPYAHYLYVGKVYVMPQNLKAAFYSEDYGFWSKKGQAKIPTNRDIKYKTPRNRSLLGQKNG